MKKFSFSLDTVLSYKEQVEEQKKGEHAAAVQSVRACEERIRRIREECQGCEKALSERKEGGIWIGEIQIYGNYIDALREREESEKQRLLLLKKRAEEKRKVMIHARQETASIRKLRNRKKEQYKKEVQKAEELQVEEFVSNQRAARLCP